MSSSMNLLPNGPAGRIITRSRSSSTPKLREVAAFSPNTSFASLEGRRSPSSSSQSQTQCDEGESPTIADDVPLASFRRNTQLADVVNSVVLKMNAARTKTSGRQNKSIALADEFDKFAGVKVAPDLTQKARSRFSLNRTAYLNPGECSQNSINITKSTNTDNKRKSGPSLPFRQEQGAKIVKEPRSAKQIPVSKFKNTNEAEKLIRVRKRSRPKNSPNPVQQKHSDFSAGCKKRKNELFLPRSEETSTGRSAFPLDRHVKPNSNPKTNHEERPRCICFAPPICPIHNKPMGFSLGPESGRSSEKFYPNSFQSTPGMTSANVTSFGAAAGLGQVMGVPAMFQGQVFLQPIFAYPLSSERQLAVPKTGSYDPSLFGFEPPRSHSHIFTNRERVPDQAAPGIHMRSSSSTMSSRMTSVETDQFEPMSSSPRSVDSEPPTLELVSNNISNVRSENCSSDYASLPPNLQPIEPDRKVAQKESKPPSHKAEKHREIIKMSKAPMAGEADIPLPLLECSDPEITDNSFTHSPPALLDRCVESNKTIEQPSNRLTKLYSKSSASDVSTVSTKTNIYASKKSNLQLGPLHVNTAEHGISIIPQTMRTSPRLAQEKKNPEHVRNNALITEKVVKKKVSSKQKRSSIRVHCNWIPIDEGLKRMVYISNVLRPVRRMCFAAIKHKRENETISERDCVLVQSGEGPSHVAKIARLFRDPVSEVLCASVVWYYRGSQLADTLDYTPHPKELLASRHIDTVPVDCINDVCFVITLNEYNRYVGENLLDSSGARLGEEAAPRATGGYARRRRQPADDTAEDSVYFARHVYDFVAKRLINNPS